MLNIAGGIVIGGCVLAVLGLGIRIAFHYELGFGDGSRAIGWLIVLATLVFAYWLIFVHTGFAPWPVPR